MLTYQGSAAWFLAPILARRKVNAVWVSEMRDIRAKKKGKRTIWQGKPGTFSINWSTVGVDYEQRIMIRNVYTHRNYIV